MYAHQQCNLMPLKISVSVSKFKVSEGARSKSDFFFSPWFQQLLNLSYIVRLFGWSQLDICAGLNTHTHTHMYVCICIALGNRYCPIVRMLWLDYDRSPSGSFLTAVTCLTNACMHCRDPSILSSVSVCFTKPAHWSLLHSQVLMHWNTSTPTHAQNVCWIYRKIHAVIYFVSTQRCGALMCVSYNKCTGHP